MATNTMRHGEAHDGGKGGSDLHESNGLRGMRERLEKFDGGLLVETADDAGFAYQLQTPLRAIHVVSRGCPLIRPAITERIARSAEPRPAPLPAAIATREGTVKNQVSPVIAKLGVRDRARTVLKGIELGMI
jgi:hypothetical protein